jgi:hypothetical protein
VTEIYPTSVEFGPGRSYSERAAYEFTLANMLPCGLVLVSAALKSTTTRRSPSIAELTPTPPPPPKDTAVQQVVLIVPSERILRSRCHLPFNRCWQLLAAHQRGLPSRLEGRRETWKSRRLGRNHRAEPAGLSTRRHARLRVVVNQLPRLRGLRFNQLRSSDRP